MTFTTSDGTKVHYRLEGREDLPVLVLSHSLGCDHGMWSPQMPALLERFRVLRYDTRGHGASDAPVGEYTLERLGRDVVELAESLGVTSFAFCGLSLGGMTGQWIAANAPDRITRLVLANTSAKFPDPSIMEARRRTVLESGVAAVADAVLGRFFMASTLASPNAHVASIRTVLLATNPVGYAGCCAAVRDLDTRAIIGKITVPTLVIAGDNDMSTPWVGHGDMLAAGIAGAKAVRLPTAHLSNIERPVEFTSALLGFLL